MNEEQNAALSALIIDHIRLARPRRETLVWLIGSILKAGTVNLNRLASHIESAAQTASVGRGRQTFFLNMMEIGKYSFHFCVGYGIDNVRACAPGARHFP